MKKYTVAQFIEKLKQYPAEADVQVAFIDEEYADTEYNIDFEYCKYDDINVNAVDLIVVV
jgi:hypothetical protein